MVKQFTKGIVVRREVAHNIRFSAVDDLRTHYIIAALKNVKQKEGDILA